MELQTAYDRLAKLVAEQGFTLTVGYLGIITPGNHVNGDTIYGDKVVYLRPGMSELQSTEVLAHELAHIRLRHGKRPMLNSIAEIEAENVASQVMVGLGFSDPWAGSYMGSWVGQLEWELRMTPHDDPELPTVRNLLGEVSPLSQEIATAIIAEVQA
jgi:hypothetical protein